MVSGRRAHYVTNLLGRTVGVARSEQDLPTGGVTLSADVAVPVPGRALVTLSVDGIRGPPVELTGANPVSYDVRARPAGRVRATRRLAVLRGPLEFNGDIVEVRISCHGEKQPDAELRRALRSSSSDCAIPCLRYSVPVLGGCWTKPFRADQSAK